MKKMLVAMSALLVSTGFVAGAAATSLDAPVEPEKGAPTAEFKSLVRSYRILGQDVRGSQNEKLGRVTQILLDPKSGQAVYVIVTSGGVLDIGEEERLVPWQALQVQPETYQVSLAMTERQFKQAPKGAIISSQRQAEEIYRYYGVAPRWQQGGASGQPPMGQGMQEQSQMPQQNQMQPENQMQQPQQNRQRIHR